MLPCLLHTVISGHTFVSSSFVMVIPDSWQFITALKYCCAFSDVGISPTYTYDIALKLKNKIKSLNYGKYFRKVHVRQLLTCHKSQSSQAKCNNSTPMADQGLASSPVSLEFKAWPWPSFGITGWLKAFDTGPGEIFKPELQRELHSAFNSSVGKWGPALANGALLSTANALSRFGTLSECRGHLLWLPCVEVPSSEVLSSCFLGRLCPVHIPYCWHWSNPTSHILSPWKKVELSSKMLHFL